MTLSSVLLRLVVGASVTRFLVLKDKPSANKPLVKRHYLTVAMLIALSLFSYPFIAKPDSYFDRFNTAVTADQSTVYQQVRRAQTWIDQQVGQGSITAEEGASMKAENDMIHKRIHSGTNRQLYIRFGDMIDYSKSIEEPPFLYAAAVSANYVLWFMSATVGVCHYLPTGGKMTILMFLLAIFCVELETRFIHPESVFDYLFFLNKNEWTLFEAINATKEAAVGIVCAVVLIAGAFGGDVSVKTKRLARQALKSNAGLVTVLRDENIKELPPKEEVPADGSDVNIAGMITRVLGLLALFSSVFFKSD